MLADISEDLARQLANPIAAPISLPFQLNYDDGKKWTLNIQPVIPFSLNDDWNIIYRTILPIISRNDIYPGAGSQTGTGDIVQSLFSRRWPHPKRLDMGCLTGFPASDRQRRAFER